MKTIQILVSTLAFACAGVFSGEQAKPIDPANFDTSVKPGVDFFRYANGTWIDKNPVPPDESRWGGFEECIEKSRIALREVVEAAAKSSAQHKSAAQLAGDFYASLMDKEQREHAGALPLELEFKRISAIASVDDLLDVIARLHTIYVGVPFGIYAGQDAKESTEVIVNLGQGGLGLPDRDYYTDPGESMKTTREQYVAHVAKMFELLGDEKAMAGKYAQTVLNFETELAKASVTRVQRRDPVKNYNKFNFEELKVLTPSISWTRLYDGMGITDRRPLNVGQPEFFKQFDTMVKSVPLEDWKTYLRWHLIHVMANVLSEPFVNEHFAFNEKILTGATELQPLWKRSLQLTDRMLPDATGQLYVAKNFSPKSKESMQKLVANILAELRERIQKLDWMSAPTKAQAQRKLSTFVVKIGYPDKWRDYSTLEIGRGPAVSNLIRIREFEFRRNINKLGKPVDRGEWGMSAPTVNAYYNDKLNEIVFPAGILQPPFFFADGDEAVNYGGIGAVIGHEIMHGFDDRGRKSDADGNLKDWWQPEDAAAYESRAAIVRKQFDDYVAIDDMHVNGSLTLGENLADLGGLSISHGALQKALEGKPREKIDGFTPEQRFFLAFAQVWRQNIRPQALKLRLRTDPHSPGRFRCNGTLSNLDEFMRAFGIKEGEPMMRPKELRARIW